ncbi:MAG: adenine deaminase [Marinifilaceae bacterium]|jgi:adenine deaminase|nr:adenine deaminase [Marinifilaceae bacterium]
MRQVIEGNLVDIYNDKIYPAKITIADKKILEISLSDKAYDNYIMPGFVDAHMHIESTMLSPAEFGRLAKKQGTISVVADPHEIANVCGVEGVKWMMDNSKQADIKIKFAIPSCVPATKFETSGYTILADDMKDLVKDKDIVALGEVMSYVDVINNDSEIIAKIKLCLDNSLVVDGHAPALSGEDIRKYCKTGISTDHECSDLDEAIEKIKLGMNILIREGSSARDFNSLYKLIDKYPESTMLCTDDLHAEDLQKFHINRIVSQAIAKSCDLFNTIRAASYNPNKHYGLNLGMLKVGDSADFIICDNLKDFTPSSVFIEGEDVLLNDKEVESLNPINNFVREKIQKQDIVLRVGEKPIPVIVVEEGSLLTDFEYISASELKSILEKPESNDYLKIVSMSRYNNEKPIVAYIKGFGIKNAAIAQSIMHDSHNIIAVGSDDEILCSAINKLIDLKGGIVVGNSEKIEFLKLDIAGLMSSMSSDMVIEKLNRLHEFTRDIKSKLESPFLTLAFMGLLVIPKLKISDLGIFDVEEQKIIEF